MRTEQLLCRNTCVVEVLEKLKTFPERYSSYRGREYPTLWTVKLVSASAERMALQLVDQNFEPPRGKSAPDAPLIHVKLAQRGEDVVLSYALRWLWWKKLLVWGAGILWAVFLYCLAGEQPAFTTAMAVLGLCLAGTWLPSNWKHDRLTQREFCRLLENDLTCEEVP